MFSTPSYADEAKFPLNEPINYLIPFSAGGESDLFARLQQPYLEKELGQKVIVNYKIGADGALAWSDLVNSPATGHYTAGINLPHIILQPLQRKNAGYKTEQLKPVMIFHVTPCVLAVRADSPYKTLDDLIKAAKEKPGSVIIGGCGNGTSGHIASVMFNKQSGLNLPYIPFPGTADLPIALLGNHVTAIMAFTSGYSQYAKEMRVLAIASEERDPNIDAPRLQHRGRLLPRSGRASGHPRLRRGQALSGLRQGQRRSRLQGESQHHGHDPDRHESRPEPRIHQ